MTNIPKNILKSIENLAKLLNLKLVKGYKKKIAEFLEIDPPEQLSKFIGRNNIPEKYLSIAAGKGFPPEKWLVLLDWASIMVEELQKQKLEPTQWLAINDRVNLIFRESKLELDEFYSKANINPPGGSEDFPLGYFQTLRAPMMVMKISDAFGYNKNWIWHNPGNPRREYAEVPEHMLPKDSGGEARPGSYGTNVDLSKHAVVQLYDPHVDLLKKFKDKKWALEINQKLVLIEQHAPEQKEYIKGVLDTLINSLKTKKKSKQK
jgi:hypothetical protein